MHLLLGLSIIFVVIRRYCCNNTLTYTVVETSTSQIQSILQSNNFILTNSSLVNRLSSNGSQYVTTTQILNTATDLASVAFIWKTGDCSFPLSFALNSPSINVISSICFTQTSLSLPNNFLQLTVTTTQLSQAATVFMTQYSLHYFTMIVGNSNQFYLNLVQQFSADLTEQSYILEQIYFYSDVVTTMSSKLSALHSKVIYIICSYNEEISLYSSIVTYAQSSLSANGVVFIFVRWSHLFASFYTSQYLPNLSLLSTSSAAFAILHLLPMDTGSTYTFNQLVNNYAQQILNMNSTTAFSDDVIFILNELESVLLLQQNLSSNISSTNWTTIMGTISFLTPQQRSFNYALIGMQCNGTWTQFRVILTNNSTISTINSNLCTNLAYPTSDTATSDDSGWRILKIVLFSLLGVVLACAGALVALLVIRSQRARKQMSKGPNKIILLPEDLMFVMPKGSIFTSKVNLKNEAHERSNASIRSEEIQAGKTARYNGDLVEVKKMHIGPLSLRTKVMRELRQLKDLRHENVNTFIGLFIDPNAPALIFEYGHRGSLEDILKKEEIKLDWNFKWSMLNDLVRGMRYLSNSSIRCHGNLKSRNCIVDSRWVLKVTDYRLNEMYALQNAPRQVDIGDLLWMSPEHVRTSIIKDDVATVMTSSSAGDVYSFGIIMQEVILRGAPFCMLDLTPQEIIAKIKKPPPLLRPSVSKQVAPPEYINSMKQCWAEQAETRPSFNDLALSIKLLNGGKKVNIVDTMFKMLEQYSNNLEDLIKERTTQLEEEKKKTDKLLSQMLPPSVAESLKSGHAVEAEWYERVTIYFSDIVGFTTISALSGPMEVVDLLNDLYTMFDSILEDFDCYKVETIGDAYMVVSGLPISNGIQHASEIATMALTLLHACGKFKIRHMPGVPLRLRIGLHSGACVAGVVGLKMPRYCLFGDTVNTASRMESTSMAFRIHTSETTAELLEEIGGFKLEYRGVTEIKGRGNYKTYWLCGKDGFDKELPQAVISEDNHGLDKELVKLVELNAREQEKREALNKAKKDIKVKPIVETETTEHNASKTEPSKPTVSSTTAPPVLATMHNDTVNPLVTDSSNTGDLLRMTPPSIPPPPPQTTSRGSTSGATVKFTTPPAAPTTIPAKFQQMNGGGGSIRKSSKAKW